MSEPTVVCVLGMHRSGTSLVARVLNLLGLDLGPAEHLMRPGAANPAGHWESRPDLGHQRRDPRASRGYLVGAARASRRAGSASPELADAPAAGARADRGAISRPPSSGASRTLANSLTAPFWQRLLAPMRYVICLRNPLDVAASLEAREEEPVPFEQGVELWLTYVRAALAATAGHRREFVFYEDLMADPEPVVRRLARFIGRRRSAPQTRRFVERIGAAVSENLWHHRTAVPNVVDAERLAFHVKALLRRPAPVRAGRREGRDQTRSTCSALMPPMRASASPSSTPARAELEEARER